MATGVPIKVDLVITPNKANVQPVVQAVEGDYDDDTATWCSMPVPKDWQREHKARKPMKIVKEVEAEDGPDLFTVSPVPRPDPPLKASREYECEYPTVERNVRRVTDALPFPEKLEDVIAWTDAFVDRIAQVAAAEKKQKEIDEKKHNEEIEKLRKVIEATSVELDKTRDALQASQAETKAAKCELATAKAEVAARDQTIKDMKAKAIKEAAEEKRLRDKNCRLSADLERARRNITELSNKLGKVDKALLEEHARWVEEHELHGLDHKELECLRAEFDVERAAKDAAKNELAACQTQLANANIALDAKDKTIESLTGDLVRLRTELECTKTRITELETRLAATDTQLVNTQCSLEEAKGAIDKLTAELAAAKQRISELDAALKDADCALADKNAELAALRDANAKATSDLAQAQADLDKANCAIERLQSSLHDAQTRAACLEAERDQLKNAVAAMEEALQRAACVEAERDQLKQTVACLEAERDQLQKSLSCVEAERDQLQKTAAEMEGAIQRALQGEEEDVERAKKEHDRHKAVVEGLLSAAKNNKGCE